MLLEQRVLSASLSARRERCWPAPSPTRKLLAVGYCAWARLRAGVGRCITTMAAAGGAALGALPPSALPPTRKLLAQLDTAAACAQMCVGFILRVRTGHESALPFYLLHFVLPLLASFPSRPMQLRAAASGRTWRGGATPRGSPAMNAR